MNIIGTEIGLQHNALEIYVAGCKAPHCPGCHNPESWEFNQGTPYRVLLPRLVQKAQCTLIDNIWILGGEPLDQDLLDLRHLIDRLDSSQKPIWLFTRYQLEDVPDSIRFWLSYVKTGQYDSDAGPGDVEHGVTLATANQHIFKLK
jgi:anaerobic ribonucleoside-triphosphate reductase activating protein